MTVAHINATAKNAADDKLRQSLRRFADTHTAPATVVLVSSKYVSCIVKNVLCLSRLWGQNSGPLLHVEVSSQTFTGNVCCVIFPKGCV